MGFLFGVHAFDQPSGKKKNHKKMYVPKSIAKGGQGVHQYLKIDETKLTSEQHYGKEINLLNIKF